MKKSKIQSKTIFLCYCILISFFFIKVVSAIGTAPQNDPSMLLYYKFSNNTDYGENNTNVYDYSGGKNNGTVYGDITLLNDSILGDFSYNITGLSNQYIKTNKIINETKDLNFTVSAWVKTYQYSNNREGIISQWGSSSDNKGFFLQKQYSYYSFCLANSSSNYQ